MSGWASSAEIRVVLPLPRKPVTRTTGTRSAIVAERGQERRVERVERTAGEALGLAPQRRQVVDDLGAALAVVEHVGGAAPVAERHAEAGEHAAHHARPQRAGAARPGGVGVGPVLGEQGSTQRAHAPIGSRKAGAKHRRESSAMAKEILCAY